MYLLNDGFLGKFPNLKSDFSGSDTFEEFEKTIKNKSSNWYFYNKNISYVYNNYGHRCKNIEEIDFENYILFAGCSHTEGIANALEDTFPYLLSKQLNCDYYNLACGGTSAESQRHNLTVWLSKFMDKPLPKYIIWQWSFSERFLQVDETGKFFQEIGSWIPEKNLQRLLVDNSLNRIFSTRDFLIAEYLRQLSIEIPLIEIVSSDIKMPNFTPNIFKYDETDKGRDNLHFGPKTNKKIAMMLEDKIINT